MRLHHGLTINGTEYPAGSEVSGWKVYPFFLFHMLVFGGSGFFMAYGGDNVPITGLYAHGGIALSVYTMFYFAIFGLDQVKWMFINAGLGAVGIYTQMGWLLQLFGRRIEDYPLERQVVPFFYYVLYTFLLRQALLDMSGARDSEERRRLVDNIYVAVSLAASGACFFLRG